jgi:hypothetical protein
MELLIFFTSITLTFSACGLGSTDRTILGETIAKEEFKSELLDTTAVEVLIKPVIPDKETAINISEAIVFKAYGKENIIAASVPNSY